MAKKLLDEGRIGRLLRVTYRSPATWGPYADRPSEAYADSWWFKSEYGGGSILDYACYGAMLSTWMFGKQAERVSCITKQFSTGFCDVEDYSAMMLDFGDGVGLLEGSWSTYNCGEVPTGPVLYGEKGVIVCDRYWSEVKIYCEDSHTPVAPTEIIDVGANNQKPEMLAEHIAMVMRGECEADEMISSALNAAVVAALDAGRKSAKTGMAEYTVIN
jgi:predicted dehydrogenase